MKTNGRLAILVASALLVTGCGGGSSTPTAHAAPAAAATAAPHSGTPLATANLTIKYPSGFHQASGHAAAQNSKRGPAYINPSPGPYGAGQIDIFVDGTDAITATPNPSASADGTQSFNIPLFATTVNTHYIVVVETDTGLGGNILAIGETDLPSTNITVGGSQSLSITLQENVSSIGLMTSPTDGNNDASLTSPFPYSSCAYPGSTVSVYPFAADPTGGFAVNNSNTSYGVGGSAVPSLSSFKPIQAYTNITNVDTVNATNGGSLSGYTITFNSTNSNPLGGVLMYFSVTNPANPIYSDAYNYYNNPGQGLYPGIENLFNSGNNVLPIYTINSNSVLNATIEVDPQYNAC